MSAFRSALAGALPKVEALRGWGEAHRRSLLVGALSLFVIGAWVSFQHLGIKVTALDPVAMLAQALLAPLSLLYAGIGMQLLARSAGTPMTLGRASAVSAWAVLAETLPLPGGAMVRAGALVAAGTDVAHSSALVLANAFLWISIAALGCGCVLLSHGAPSAALLALVGAISTVLTFAWLARMAGLALAVKTAFHRLSGMALIAVRLRFAFLTLGVAVPLADTLPFALANIAGSAASIAPAGLGISEALAAAAAGTVKVAPAAAFLAVGLDRLICLAASSLLALFSARRQSATA